MYYSNQHWTHLEIIVWNQLFFRRECWGTHCLQKYLNRFRKHFFRKSKKNEESFFLKCGINRAYLFGTVESFWRDSKVVKNIFQQQWDAIASITEGFHQCEASLISILWNKRSNIFVPTVFVFVSGICEHQAQSSGWKIGKSICENASCCLNWKTFNYQWSSSHKIWQKRLWDILSEISFQRILCLEESGRLRLWL